MVSIIGRVAPFVSVSLLVCAERPKGCPSLLPPWLMPPIAPHLFYAERPKGCLSFLPLWFLPSIVSVLLGCSPRRRRCSGLLNSPCGCLPTTRGTPLAARTCPLCVEPFHIEYTLACFYLLEMTICRSSRLFPTDPVLFGIRALCLSWSLFGSKWWFLVGLWIISGLGWGHSLEYCLLGRLGRLGWDLNLFRIGNCCSRLSGMLVGLGLF